MIFFFVTVRIIINNLKYVKPDATHSGTVSGGMHLYKCLRPAITSEKKMMVRIHIQCANWHRQCHRTFWFLSLSVVHDFGSDVTCFFPFLTSPAFQADINISPFVGKTNLCENAGKDHNDQWTYRNGKQPGHQCGGEKITEGKFR